MASPDVKVKMKEFLEHRFEKKASPVFMARVGRIIDTMPDDSSGVSQSINNIRIAVKLLFDDSLADDIHEELRLMAKYSDRIR